MKKRFTSASALLSATMLLILILDSKTAIRGANRGVELCLKTLIPTLFPFLVISDACGKLLAGLRIRVLEILLYPCNLPKGTETIFLIGLLGGYPIGAKLIYDTYKRGNITKSDAERMLMFCSNAGPSFIFGVLGALFSDNRIPWVIWFIHILSAYLTGILTAKPVLNHISNDYTEAFSLTEAVSNSVKSMSNICGWVILFRVILTFLDKWFLQAFPIPLRIFITGLFELSNGCAQVSLIENTAIRFMIGLLIVTFGGACVVLQTGSLTPTLSIKYYFTGKLYQCMIAITIAIPLILIQSVYCKLIFLTMYMLTFLTLKKERKKKIVAFRNKMVYNIKKADM